MSSARYRLLNTAMETKDLLRILGYEAFWKLEHIYRLQQLIFDLAIRHRNEDDDQEELNELRDAAITIPRNAITIARNRCIALLESIDRDSEESDDEENMIMEDSVHEKNTTNQLSSGGKRFRYARSPNSGQTSESDMEEVQAKRLCRRRKLKKKTEVKNQSCISSDDENSMSIDITSVNKTEPTKELQSIYDSTSNSVNKNRIKTAVVKLIDFMNDSSADNDEYIAQYKQSYGYKDDKEYEYEILDEADGDVDLDQTTGSDHNFDNNDEEDNEEDRISVKSHESQDHELDSELSKSTASKEFNSDIK